MRSKLVLVILVFGALSAFGQTDLFDAAKNGTLAQLEMALKPGVEINQRLPETGMTPLMVAAKYSHYPEVINALLKAGARIDDRDETDNATPLMIAAGWNTNPAIVQAFLAAGAKMDDRDKYNNKTPLMFAAMHTTNPEIILVLLRAGADGRLKSFKGLTAFDYADRNPDLKGSIAWQELGKLRE